MHTQVLDRQANYRDTVGLQTINSGHSDDLSQLPWPYASSWEHKTDSVTRGERQKMVEKEVTGSD